MCLCFVLVGVLGCVFVLGGRRCTCLFLLSVLEVYARDRREKENDIRYDHKQVIKE